jgi:hypothetical protein
MHKYLVILFVMFLGGCGPFPQYGWYKESASQEEAARDRYDCLREAQQRVSGAQVGPYGGTAAKYGHHKSRVV